MRGIKVDRGGFVFHQCATTVIYRYSRHPNHFFPVAINFALLPMKFFVCIYIMNTLYLFKQL